MLGISQNLKDEFQQHVDLHEEEDTTEELIQRLESCVHFCEKSERYELMLEVSGLVQRSTFNVLILIINSIMCVI